MSTIETEEAPATRKVAIKDMTPRVLDWLIAKLLNPEWGEEGWIVHTAYPDDDSGWVFQPTRHWEQGGQLMQEYGISWSAIIVDDQETPGWQASHSARFPKVMTREAISAMRTEGPVENCPKMATMKVLAMVLLGVRDKAEEVEVPEEVFNEA